MFEAEQLEFVVNNEDENKKMHKNEPKHGSKQNKIKTPKDFTCTVDVTDKRICLTGEFKCGDRDIIKAHLVHLGANIVSSISSKTDYLIIGDLGTTTTHKIDDAKKYRVEIVKEKDFIKTSDNVKVIRITDYKPKEPLEEFLKDFFINYCKSKRTDPDIVGVKITNFGLSIYLCESKEYLDMKGNPSQRIYSISHKKSKDTYNIALYVGRLNSSRFVPAPQGIIFRKDDMTITFNGDTDTLRKYLCDVFEWEFENFSPSYKFGCCGKYEQCSKAYMCLHDNSIYSLGCRYKEKLESGKIFYGENRNVD